MTNPTTPTTWRDLADNLTAQQVHRFNWREQVLHGTPEEIQDLLLTQAQEHADANRRDRELFPDVPEPHGFDFVWHWEADPGTGDFRRVCEGSIHRISGVSIAVDGTQWPDGSVSTVVALDCNTGSFDVGTARQILAALQAAIDKAESLSQP